MGCQLRVSTNRVQVCDGRAHDMEEKETYLGVRNINDNLKSTDSEASSPHTCHMLVLPGIRLEFYYCSRLVTVQCKSTRQVGKAKWQ